VKEHIVDMAMNASGIRDTARVLHISTNTVMTELKKRGFDHRAGHFRPPGMVEGIAKPPVLQGLRCFYLGPSFAGVAGAMIKALQ